MAESQRLAPGQSIEVTTEKGESLKGTFASVSEGAIKPGAEASERSPFASEVARVSLRSSKPRNYMLIGLAVVPAQAPASARAWREPRQRERRPTLGT